MRQLKGQLAVVTGAAQGIGRAIALSLAKRGVRVVCLDKNDKLNTATVQKAAQYDVLCVARHCDVSRPEEIDRVFDEITAQQGAVDILVNNAAVFSTVSVAQHSFETALEDFERNINTNARGTFLCAKKLAPHMAAHGGGQIINVITNHVKRHLFPPSANEHSYDASKYAQLALNESLASELRQYGIRVNAICPAATRTPMLQGFFDAIGMELTKENIGKCAGIASLLECEEVGEAVCHILEWDDNQPTGQAYLLLHSQDCEALKNGTVEDLAK